MHDILQMVGNDPDRLARLATTTGVFDDDAVFGGVCLTVLDLQGRLSSINAQGVKTLRIDGTVLNEIQGRTWASLWPDEERPRVEQAVAEALNGRQVAFTAKAPNGAGEERWWDVEIIPLLDYDGCPPALVVALTDISRLKESQRELEAELDARDEMLQALSIQLEEQNARIQELEQQANQADKLNALGAFVGTVVHDINNLLTVMQSATRIMRRRAPVEELTDIYDEVDASVQKGQSLVRELLDFARTDGNDHEAVCVGLVLGRDKDLMARLLGEKVGFEFSSNDDGWAVLSESSRISSVAFNLLSNARDAMPDGGTVTMRVETCPSASRPEGLSMGDYVRLVVKDTGIGMSPDVLRRLGQPYFTTKAKGHGTGIGVGAAFELARRCKGQVFFHSVEGEGTEVEIYLARADVSPRALDDDDGTVIEAGDHGDGRILLVDRNPAVRAEMKLILETLGYNVSETASFAWARSLGRGQDIFDLVIADLDSDSHGATQMVDALIDAMPGLRAVFSSTMPISAEALSGPVLRKPVSARTLAEAVLIALGRRPGIALSSTAMGRSDKVRDRLTLPAMRSAYDLWHQSSATGNALPTVALAETLRAADPDNAYLVTCDPCAPEGRARFEFAWAGRTLEEALGRPLAGAAVDDEDETKVGMMRRAFERGRRGVAFYDYARLSFGESGTSRFERLLLPLSENGRTTTHLFGLASIEDSSADD